MAGLPGPLAHKMSFCFLFLFISFSLFAQNQSLPFAISEKRKLSQEDINKKKQGWYPTALPLFGSDPNAGLAYGFALFLFNNKTRKDPFFNYTPYRYKFSFVGVRTSRDVSIFLFAFDSPFLADSKWRLRSRWLASFNPRATYFGNDAGTLKPLSYRKRNQPDSQLVTNAPFEEYEKNLAYRRSASSYWFMPYQTESMYNRYILKRRNGSVNLERNFFRGLVRIVGGLSFSQTAIDTYDYKVFAAPDPLYGDTSIPIVNSPIPTRHGMTKVTEDAREGKIYGIEGGYINSIRLGVVYDSRDLETNPSRGIFWEGTYERSEPVIGSDFSFSRYFSQIKYYKKLLPNIIDKMVFAGRVGLSRTEGNCPFFSCQRIWTSEKQIIALGGNFTLRGYVINRFVARVMAFGNFEIRYRWFTLGYRDNHFSFYLVPIYDIGKVWDKMSEVDRVDYKHSHGLGLRIVVNHAIVLSFDYSQSRESKQFFMSFNHVF